MLVMGWTQQEWVWVMEHFGMAAATLEGALELQQRWLLAGNEAPHPIPPLLRAVRFPNPAVRNPYEHAAHQLFIHAKLETKVTYG